jgi:hypothetical protein
VSLLRLLLAFVVLCTLAVAQVRITTTTLPNGNVGTSYSAVIQTTGGSIPFTWTVASGSLPPGITMSPSVDTRSLTLSGTPSAAGTYAFSISVRGHGGHISTVAYSVTMQTATATYALTVGLAGTGSGTVASNPVGINCPATCTAKFNSGALVTLTALPATGSMFAGWSGACSGTAPCSVTMSAARSVTATFNVLASHVVDLSWNASTGAIGYNTYRGTVSGGPYTLVNPGLVAATLYTDATVVSGTTYFYVVTSVDNTGTESGYSSEATAIVPN